MTLGNVIVRWCHCPGCRGLVVRPPAAGCLVCECCDADLKMCDWQLSALGDVPMRRLGTSEEDRNA